MHETAEEVPTTRQRPPGQGRILGWFRDPARAFATFAVLFGVAIAVLAPPFSGIDEPSHFGRAVRLSEGAPLPDDPPPDMVAPLPALEGVGQCLDRALLHEMSLDIIANRFAGTPWSEEDSRKRYPRCNDDDSRGFYANATFSWYSPLGYAPQAVAVKVGDLFGLSVAGQLFLARLATLATYVALVAVAVWRAPFGRWALAAVGLLPVALYEAATSVSPDAFTTAMVVFVLSSALRGVARPERVGTPAYLAEALVAAVALGFAKPTYVVFALAYLLPLLQRPWPRRWWATVLPPVVGGGLSTLWYQSRRSTFTCDVTLFGKVPDPDAQLSSLLTGPHQLVGAAAGAVPGKAGAWVTDTFQVGVTVSPSLAAGWVVASGIALFALAGAQRTRAEVDTPTWGVRAGLAGLGVLGYLGVLGGWLVYCSDPVWEVDNSPHTRLLLPILPAFALALAPVRAWARRLNRFIVPVVAGVAAFDLVFVLVLTR